MTDLRDRLVRAATRTDRPSSDFDLNPSVVLPENRKLRAAGVLIGVIEGGGGARVLLTKRSSALKHHPGQIAFPGGKVDPVDADVVAAAIRETHEETGVPPETIEVIGTLAPHETVTGFQVTPVLALLTPPSAYRREAGEVDEVFEVPLAHLLDARNYSVQSRLWRGQSRSYFTVPWGPYYIWGATARILRGLADRMADDTT
ncbi:CoA pyrophosphatase [Alphaproteobacteria bacterium GH1-50]|uniref:CoA pyrophosphatase n=1 Tax=Kangsaoukella pontilimi TaxID=2691042 RepID=A0A7C9IGU9_9RHOB|nr:CoA pyrophosphatase [Kangsaoukella pontilimi]MXQ08269.1 CoA pyrophosphatase [Kangsaoukella pontilimi]